MYLAIGFLIMGFIGYFVKLIHIPINNIIVGWKHLYAKARKIVNFSTETNNQKKLSLSSLSYLNVSSYLTKFFVQSSNKFTRAVPNDITSISVASYTCISTCVRSIFQLNLERIEREILEVKFHFRNIPKPFFPFKTWGLWSLK